MSDATRMLAAIQNGDPHAAAELLPLVYDELRRLARKNLARESPGQTIDATGLVHEAYVRLVGALDHRSYADRGHFFAAAAQAMRRILVDRARRKQRDRRGGGRKRIPLDDAAVAVQSTPEGLLALDEALTRLATQDPEAAALVDLRCFAGMSIEAAATSLGMSRATAYRHWTFARAWLLGQL